MPTTSEIRRALAAFRPPRRQTSAQLLPFFPAVERPHGIPPLDDAGLLDFAEYCTLLLAPHLPPQWSPPYDRFAARLHLCRWCQWVNRAIEASPQRDRINARLLGAPPWTLPTIDTWLRGRWHNRPDELAQLAWRLGLSQRTVSAVLWIHRVGA